MHCRCTLPPLPVLSSPGPSRLLQLQLRSEISRTVSCSCSNLPSLHISLGRTYLVMMMKAANIYWRLLELAGEHVYVATHKCKKNNYLLELITCNKKNLSLVNKGLLVFSVMWNRNLWSSEVRIQSSRAPLLSDLLAGEAPVFSRPQVPRWYTLTCVLSSLCI